MKINTKRLNQIRIMNQKKIFKSHNKKKMT